VLPHQDGPPRSLDIFDTFGKTVAKCAYMVSRRPWPDRRLDPI